MPPENVRKPKVFWSFPGVQKWNITLRWVNLFNTILQYITCYEDLLCVTMQINWLVSIWLVANGINLCTHSDYGKTQNQKRLYSGLFSIVFHCYCCYYSIFSSLIPDVFYPSFFIYYKTALKMPIVIDSSQSDGFIQNLSLRRNLW